MTDRPPATNLPRPVAYVFGGGASSAAAQVGMLRASMEAGISPDLIVGTSAGALNGALLAEDPGTASDRLTAIWTDLETRHLLPESRFRRARNLAGRRHLYLNEGLRRFFEKHFQAQRIEDLSLPFACVATDLDEGTPAILDSGPLLTALLASCAIPGVFPAIERDGRALADGLCVANIPTRQALELGAASLVIFDGRPAVQPQRERGDVRDVVSAAFAAVLAHQSRCDIEHARERVPVLCLPGQPPTRLKAFEFNETAAIMTRAHESTREYLARVADNAVVEVG